MISRMLFAGVAALLGAAACPVLAEPASAPVVQATTAAPVDPQQAAHRILKRKIAVARFTNISRYGKSLLADSDHDPLAEQAADMLTARLVASGKFLVFERSARDEIARETALIPDKTTADPGVDAVVIGAITEFGRKTDGVAGFLNSSMRQKASATVEVRLVDVRTRQAFFSSKGVGSAETVAKEVAGFGGRAGYDDTQNDKAMSAAISDLINNVIQKLEERRWSSDVLQIRGASLFVSGGPSQGLKPGDHFIIETKGETLTSGQNGLPITLPGEKIAEIEVVSFFGDQPSSEGSVCKVISGSLAGRAPKDLIVAEAS